MLCIVILHCIILQSLCALRLHALVYQVCICLVLSLLVLSCYVYCVCLSMNQWCCLWTVVLVLKFRYLLFIYYMYTVYAHVKSFTIVKNHIVTGWHLKLVSWRFNQCDDLLTYLLCLLTVCLLSWKNAGYYLLAFLFYMWTVCRCLGLRRLSLQVLVLKCLVFVKGSVRDGQLIELIVIY